MDINATLIAQAVVMIVFVAICWRYIYPPILAIMHEREKKISDGLEAAKKADDSLEEAKLAFDKELNTAKAEAAEIVDKANVRASKIVSDASIKAETDLLIPYLELFQNKGMPGEFLQHNYLNSKKPLIDFLKEHI